MATQGDCHDAAASKSAAPAANHMLDERNIVDAMTLASSIFPRYTTAIA